MRLPGGVHLTYCSNIHPGEGWHEVFENLRTYLPRIRQPLSPDKPFGIGLRLSAQAARELAAPKTLLHFKTYLQDHEFYVFTLNGFPYGPFHGRPVKANVYRPDWRQRERLAYTNLLADLLVALLPDDPQLEGSISTVPIGFAPDLRTSEEMAVACHQVVEHVAHLVSIEQRTGRRLMLGLEPEPCCVLETMAQTIDLFTGWFHAEGTQALAKLTGLDQQQADAALRDHLGICLDLCHAAVEFEDLDQVLEQLDQARIPIVKLQISSGLRVCQFTEEVLHRLEQFTDDVYLHQVIERRADKIRRFLDLPEALATLPSGASDREWRVHFHVPIFHTNLGTFSSTRSMVEQALNRQRQTPISKHLEVETYTWDVLPPDMKALPIEEAIGRELLWVKRLLGV
jgi:sugar phosphate isomerase/epimerase